jgi:5-methylcytosine-specific restriction endonuclease McrA
VTAAPDPKRSSAFDVETRRCYICKRDLPLEEFRTITASSQGGRYRYVQPSHDCRDCNKAYKREQRRKKAEAEGRLFVSRDDMDARRAQRSADNEMRKAARQLLLRAAWAICRAFRALSVDARAERMARRVRQQRERYHTDPEYWAARKALKIRRKRAQEGTEVERVSLLRVAERDGWVCSLCGGVVKRTSDDTRETWSMDHVVPLSKGGHHTYENVRLAHRGCNSAKGNRGTPRSTGPSTGPSGQYG